MKIPSPIELQYNGERIKFRFIPNNHKSSVLCDKCKLPSDDILGISQIGHWESLSNYPIIYLHYYHAPYMIINDEYQGTYIEIIER
jgi:hypothetical protein